MKTASETADRQNSVSQPKATEPTLPRKNKRIDPEAKKLLVLETARRLFVQRGYHNVSIPAIVKESGVSTGAIYSYFPNKEVLAATIHDQTLEDFYTRFLQRLEGREETCDKLRAFAEVVFELTEQEPEQMEYLLFMRHGEFMQGYSPICFTQPFQLIQGILKEGVERGDILSDDFFVAGIAFTGVILRASELRLKCVLDKPLPEISEQLLAHAWKAISA